MSGGAMNAQQSTFHGSSRSFTDVRSAATPDSRKDSAFGTMFGNTSSTWGSGNIWGSGSGSAGGSLTNGFNSKDVTRSSSRSGERQLGSASQKEPTEGKTGSGSLLQGTTALSNWPNSSSRRHEPSSRSFSQTAYAGQPAQQQRSFSNAGLQQSRSGAPQSVASAFTARTPAVDLTTSAQPRPSFGSGLQSGFEGRNNPPPVYTKLDRQTDSSRTRFDSAFTPSNDPSPTNVRFAPNSFKQWSESSSRDGSQPPSHHSSQQPSWPPNEISRSAQGVMPSKSQDTPYTQPSNAYSSFNSLSADQLASQLSQLRFNGQDTRSRAFRPTTAASSFVPYSSSQNVARNSSRSGLNGMQTPFEPSEGIEEVDRFNAGFESFVSPAETGEYRSANYGSRFMQPATGLDYRGVTNHTPNNAMPHSFDLPTGPRLPAEWQNYVNEGAMQVSRRSPASHTQQPHVDPRLQELIEAQLRNLYTPVYNPYALASGVHISSLGPYLPSLPMHVNGVDPRSGSREPPSGDNVQSALMYEFKSNTKTRRYELKDIYDHIAEFSGDQYGSRFIQTKLETANSDEKDRVFREIQPNATQLMIDVFGNYVIQKFFEHGDQTHKKILANKMRGQVLTLSMQMYGCRVVQKALEHVLVDQQAMLISELEGHVLKCVKDQNGNHVIQKAIERCPSHTIGFIIDAFRGQVQILSIHPYGCRVIQRCLERCDTPSKAMIMTELMDGIQGMISDPYGNYVVQYVVLKDEGHGRQRVLQIVLRGLEGYSKHKVASNVVEKCLEQADDHWKRQVVYTLADCNQRRVESDGVLTSMIKDNFGNYVIQKILDTLCAEDFAFFVDLLQPAVNQARRTGCGKQLPAVEKKMHRLPPRWNGSSNNGNYSHHPYQLPLPTPPFTSHYASAATTPPPLLADTQSLQSSAIPSVNGDAVEGADRSRKSSEPIGDGRYV